MVWSKHENQHGNWTQIGGNITGNADGRISALGSPSPLTAKLLLVGLTMGTGFRYLNVGGDYCIIYINLSIMIELQ
jgi:hypothetical protein